MSRIVLLVRINRKFSNYNLALMNKHLYQQKLSGDRFCGVPLGVFATWIDLSTFRLMRRQTLLSTIIRIWVTIAVARVTAGRWARVGAGIGGKASALLQINVICLGVQLRFVFLQSSKPFLWEFRTSTDSLMPDNGEICTTTKVLGDCNGVI